MLSSIVEEMLTDTAIFTLMNVLRLWKASLHSCQDLRPRVTSAMEEEEEEAKAGTEQIISIIFWTSCFGLSRSSCLLARQSRTAEQSRQSLPGQKSFFRPWSEASQDRAGEMRNLCQCQATRLPDTVEAAALAADTCGRVCGGVAEHPPFAVNKPTPCLQTKAPKRV